MTNLDKELVTRCLLKQHRSWEDFVDRFLGLVLHVIDHTASKRNIRLKLEDRNILCEQVFAALGHNDYQNLRNFKGNCSLTTYLCVLARRITVRLLANLVNATVPSNNVSRASA
jgi:RNA polymerase sigma-70 factor (ECF subfamily)